MPTATVPLAARLREATHALHVQVERSGLMARLLRGELPRPGYVLMLRQLQALYETMEDGLRQHRDDPGLLPLDLAPLFRAAALADDLDVLHGPGWAALPLDGATQDYVARLRELADTWPAGLAAHAYVRYLGDLSGGQAVRRIVARQHGLGDGPGTCFYDFGPAEAVAMRAGALRAALDRIAPDEATASALVDEAVAAFAAHGRMFDALAARVAAAPA